MDITKNIKACIDTRTLAAELLQSVLKKFKTGSEVDLRDEIRRALAAKPELYPSGWYDPPPSGIGVIFGNKDNAERSKFPHLRKEPYWPKTKYTFNKETIGMVHVSPVDRTTGIIGDIGFSWYLGQDQKIKNHLKICLEVIEEQADYVRAGMVFSEINGYAQKLFAKRKLYDSLTTNYYYDPGGISLGHTIPWTNEAPSVEEQKIIRDGNIDTLKAAIARERRYINSGDQFVIPKTVAFTIEAQLTNISQPELPNAYYHVIVTFQNGQKRVVSNFNQMFGTLGIDYMRSKF